VLKLIENGAINYNLFLLAHVESVSDILHSVEYSLIHPEAMFSLDGEKGMLNEIAAIATLVVNCSEKLVSYRLQANKPYTMHESNPLARIIIARCGLLPTHLIFSILSAVIVCITYALSWTSPVASGCLWLELICSTIVFSNNLFLEKRR
jgi:hypothetical protein